ncbi:MAG: hypothetical protein HDS97_03125 [Bacteroidales bacterium]|nr:hypothetical protein [Bacteroidales bacterium]
MKKLMSANFVMRLVAAVAMVFAGLIPTHAVKAGEEPIITFHTDILNQTNAGSVFTIMLGASKDTYIEVDYGYGPVEEEVKQAYFDEESGALKGTYFTCSASPEGIVKIYGDASLIDVFDGQGCYIDEISFPELTNLQVLDLGYNLLKSLDVSHMKKLQALYLQANPFDVTPLVVGEDKPELTILELNMIDNIDPDFDITTYPNLMSFGAYSTHSLTHIDPTKCPHLVRLSVDATAVSSIDVSKNPELLILNISETRVGSVDLSHNPKLQQFYCTNGGTVFTDVKISNLDLTHNPALTTLFCSGNNISNLDVSKNPLLVDLYAGHNKMTEINLDNNDQLINLDVSFNNMDYATLPDPRFYEYRYGQNDMPVELSYKEGDVIDLSSRVLRPNTETVGKLIYYNPRNPLEVNEVPGDYYSYDNGKITLNKALTDSVYVAFYNTLFTEGSLNTTRFKVKTAADFGQPSPAVSVGFSSAATTVEMSVGLANATPENPITFYVDFGKGTLKEFTATSSELPATANVTGRREGDQTIIYLPEGEYLTAFGVSRGRISETDFSQAGQLKELAINGCQLSEIDLSWNNMLTYLNLDNNNLTYLSLVAGNGRFEKVWLREISAKNNRITSFAGGDARAALKIDLSNNQLTGFDDTNYFDLKELYLSNNNIQEFDMNDLEALTVLDLAGNHLSNILIPPYVLLENFDLSYNDMPFAALPAAGCYDNYVYAPQNKVEVPSKAPSINLTKYLYTDSKGQTTSFVWRTVEGDKVLTDAQIMNENGRFKFLDTSVGEVYCTMTHPAFPAFEGKDAYMTTNVLAAEMPTNVFATFTTTENATAAMSLAGKTNGTTVYIDWKDDGNLEQYVLQNTFTAYDINTTAGANVKCYSYDDNDNVTVFSFNGVKVSALDASKMKQLTLFAWDNSNLSTVDFKLPVCPALKEFRLVGNGLTKQIDINTIYPNLEMVNFSGNNLETLDVAGHNNLQALYATDNKLKEVKLDNARLWDLGLNSNELESIDLSKLPALAQLGITNNKLTTIDLDNNPALRVLSLQYNNFTIATLPFPKDSWYIYGYSDQLPLNPDVKEGHIVDLSAQAERMGVATEFRWFVNSPWFDELGDLQGEELIEGEEYEIEDGVTTFKKTLDDVMCVMINPLFPDLYQYTYLLDIRMAGVDEVGVDAAAEGDVEYYDLSGVRVVNPESGIYIRRQNGKTSKVLVK